jgi:hypothetical protein
MRYLLFVTGERRKETGPGSVQLGVAHEYETRTHSVEANDDITAREEAQKIIQSYLSNLTIWKWLKVESTELYRPIGVN